MTSDGSRGVRPNVVLAICCTSVLLMSMDMTIVNVALPAIRHDFGSRTTGLQWLLDAYTLVVASLLMVSGSLADRFGRRLTFQCGLVIFTVGSGLCGVAPTLYALIAFRTLQGVGASMMNPVAMSIVTMTFLEPASRARAIGIWGGVAGLSMAIGPIIGGALTESVGWRAIFWINVPIGILAVVLTQRYVAESKAARARRLDPLAQLLVFGTLAGLTYAVIEGKVRGFGSLPIIGLLGGVAVALVTLVVHESRRVEPLIDPRFFRNASFASAILIALASFSSFAGLLFLTALYLQETRHATAFEAGLYMLPIALAMMVCSPISGRLVGRYGARLSLVSAGVAIAVAALLLTTTDASTSRGYLIAAYVIFGIGMGLVNAPITNAAVSGMPRAQAGVASAIASTSRQAGAALGIASAGAIAGTSTHAYWWLVTLLGGVVVVLGIVSTGEWAKGTARRVAALLEEPT